MSSGRPRPGQIGWVDLTVDSAESLRGFYESVVGWQAAPVPMGDYNDYSMLPSQTEQAVAGICHARGVNASIPSKWMIYIVVESLDRSLEACRANGGKVVDGPRRLDGSSQMAVIEDPAGAVFAIWEQSNE